MHPSSQQTIAKKQIASLGKGRSISDSDSYVPSRKASEGNSLYQSEEHNEEQSQPHGQSEPQDGPFTSQGTSQGITCTRHESNIAEPDSGSDDTPDDEKGGKVARDGT